MAENSHISWTDNTHNEWLGCTKVSKGCDNCYAERLMSTRYGRIGWGKGEPRALTSEANRRKPLAWDRQARKEGRRIRVFTASLSDVFDEEVPDAWRDGLFRTMFDTPNLDWLVLTKRVAKMRRYLAANAIPPNAWWGCSVEDQPTAVQRVGELLKLRALVGDAPLWLSVEPLIGPVNLSRWIDCIAQAWNGKWIRINDFDRDGIDWVIVGGESGPGARPMHPDWALSLRDQCVAAGVSFHFKQWGEYVGGCGDPKMFISLENGVEMAGGKDTHDWGNGYVSQRVGKKAAGRLLNGREWNEFPSRRT